MSLPPPIPHEEAQQRLLALAPSVGSEALAIGDALGRYVAMPLKANRTQPPADLSAMDGYAVRANDCEGPWTVSGESAAGHPYAGSIAKGEAIRISTGALLPEGAGAILLQENAARSDDTLQRNSKDAATPRHIRSRGLDFRKGDEVIAAGTRLSAAHIALAISGGHGKLTVSKRPRLAILDNGDELAADPAQTAMHQIPASNGAMLAAMTAPYATDIRRLGPVPDDKAALRDALAGAESADVIVTSGGASVGGHDLVRPALEDWGAALDFWRIAMKPGKPLMVAMRGKQIILGLPGNPVSSFVTAWLFLLPLLRKMAGANSPAPQRVILPCAIDLPTNGPRATFLRARITKRGVIPVEQQDSSALAALARSDALIERPINAAESPAGTAQTVFPLGFPTGY